MGNENNIYLTMGPDEQDGFVATIEGLKHVSEGSETVVHIPENAIHIFDRESGRALRNRTIEDRSLAEPQP